MIRLVMVKKEDSLEITETGYYLTWVYTPIVNGIRKFYILPCSKFENDPGFFPLNDDYVQMKNFISISRRLLNRENLNINEYRYLDGRWTLNY
jgi:poly-gamma-glutamate synthesis protein (capsule biosynthesis protein)